MRKTRWVFLLALFPALLSLSAQNVDNTQYVKDYLRQHPTWTVGQGVIAAQTACNADTSIPCIIVFDPSLAKYAAGTMPAPCSQCQWLDYRNGAPYLPSGGGSLSGPVTGFLDKGSQVYNVLAYGAKGDGVTDDTAAILAAISACNTSASGRGTVLVPWGRYLIGSSNVQLMFTNGAAAGQLIHCSFNAHDATFVPSATFTDGFQLMGTPAKGGPLFHTITADIASGATTLTLDSVSGYSVGQLGYYAYGQVPTNIHETLNNGFATITAINAGTNTITLDTQLSAPMTAASTPAENRWFFVPNTLDGISIDFGFIDNSANGCSTAPCTGKNNFEAAFYPSFVRGGSIQGRCYEGYNCWYIQFGSGIDFPSLISDSATQTAGGDTSYGRCGDFSEVSDSTIHVLKCKNFVNGAVALEAAERNVIFDSVQLSDNAISPGTNNCYFCTGDSSIFRVGTFKAEGLGSVSGTTQGTLVSGNGPVQADFGTVIDGTVNGIGIGVGGSTTLANIGTFQVLKVPAGVTGTSPVSGTFSSALPYSGPEGGWTCTVNLSNTATQFCNLPAGVVRSFQITSQVGSADYTSIVPGYGTFGQGSSFSSSLVAGVPLDLTSTLGSWGQNDLHSANSPFNYLAFTPAVGKSGTDTLTITGSYWPLSFTGYTTPYPMAAINAGPVPASATCLGTNSGGQLVSGCHGSFAGMTPALTSVNTAAIYSPFIPLQTQQLQKIAGVATSFACTVNPVFALVDCGADTTCVSPTVIANVTYSAANSYNWASGGGVITAGDLLAWKLTSGTCTALQVQAQVTF